jgi:hypothetical protein
MITVPPLPLLSPFWGGFQLNAVCSWGRRQKRGRPSHGQRFFPKRLVTQAHSYPFMCRAAMLPYPISPHQSGKPCEGTDYISRTSHETTSFSGQNDHRPSPPPSQSVFGGIQLKNAVCSWERGQKGEDPRMGNNHHPRWDDLACATTTTPNLVIGL